MIHNKLDNRSLILGMASDVAQTLGPVHQPSPLRNETAEQEGGTKCGSSGTGCGSRDICFETWGIAELKFSDGSRVS
jgi:hypothetical protein